MNELWKEYPKIKEKLDYFEEYLLVMLQARQPLIHQTVADLAKAGGKRLRPALVFASGFIGGASIEDLTPLAAAVEIMHMATLVHDDIIDDAELRRGVPTTQVQYGKDVAVFTGDYLFAQTFLLLAGEVKEELLRRMARGIKLICEGEIDQYENRFNLDVSFLKYFRRIRRKTAILFGVSCFSGGYQAKLKTKHLTPLSKFGKYFGMLFQITDDILDVASTREQTGKPVGNDFTQGVYTLPVIFALQDEKIGPVLREALQGEVTDKENILDLIHSTDALNKTKQIVELYAKKARKEIAKLPKIEEVGFLNDLLERVISRSY